MLSISERWSRTRSESHLDLVRSNIVYTTGAVFCLVASVVFADNPAASAGLFAMSCAILGAETAPRTGEMIFRQVARVNL